MLFLNWSFVARSLPPFFFGTAVTFAVASVNAGLAANTAAASAAQAPQSVPLAKASDGKKSAEISFEAVNLQRNLNRYVREPHPMGSPEQKKLAREIKLDVAKTGWKTEIVNFKATVPNLAAERFGGTEKKAEPSINIEGENILAVRKGRDKCAVVIGGHYDTKHFRGVKFVGANDGGSSTILMQEFARVVSVLDKKEHTKKTGRYLDCTLVLAFFDGEEATLADWSEGQTQLGLQDNLYGSRAFVQSLEKGKSRPEFRGLPVKLVMVIDMVGHKDQNLFITAGSQAFMSQQLVALKTTTKIAMVPIAIEDDHVPFLKLGVPFIHIIDWTNLKEWHTPADNAEIISVQKLADFGNLLIRFFEQKREDGNG